MTNPFARPDQPDSDETIPLVPDSGYPDQPSPWSSGYEATAVDPFTTDTQPAAEDHPRPSAPAGNYTNPTVSPGSYSNPTLPTPTPAPYPGPVPASGGYPNLAPARYPSPAQPASSPYGLPTTAPVYEQPPVSYGAGPFEPAREQPSNQLAPVYYVHSPQPVDHPNAIPALVLGVLGFVVGVTFPIAWYLGAKGNADVKREPQRYRSNAAMTIGMVLGIIGTVFMALGVLLFVVAIIAFMAVGG